MKTKITQLLLGLLLLSSSVAEAQFISIVNKKFVVNGSCQIYLNGANTPWEAWNDFGSASFNNAKWKQDMVDLKSKGINASRIWISCNGDGQPSVATDGTVSAPTATFWKNCDSLFKFAQANGVYIMATMMSFDHTKTGNNNANNWRAMMSDTAKIRTYINNYLVPFVNRYKTNPYLGSIDIGNEIEWIAEDATNWKCSYAVLQRFVAMNCVALHQSSVARSDGSKVLITMGSAGTKWNATKMRNGSFGASMQNNSDGNKWSDAALKAVYNHSLATLDFYSPHFYGWLNEWYSNMFEKSPADFGMDEKLCMVGEMPARDPFPIPLTSSTNTSWKMIDAMNALKTLGWQGHQPWTSNITTNLTTEVGSLADFGTAALAFKNANSSLVYPTCAVAPKCQVPNLGADKSLCGVSGGITLNSNISITTNKTFKWYKDGNVVTGSAATLASVTAAGTYVVQVDSSSGKCVVTDTVVLSSIIPSPIIQGAKLCNPSFTTLTTSVSGSGLTYTWASDVTTPYATADLNSIAGETTSSLANVRTPGWYRLTVSASGCNSVSDTAVIVSSNPTPVDGCKSTTGNVDLSISNTTGSSYAWYSVATGGTSLGTGTSFKTPSIATTTTYYVENTGTVNTSVGPTALLGTSTDWGVSAGNQLLFTPSADFSLLSVKVPMNIYNAGTVSMIVEVLDGNGNAFSPAKTFTGTSGTLSASNNQLVTFNFTGFDIKKSWGATLRMRVSSVSAGSPLYSAGPASYPYSVANVVSITGEAGGSSSSDYMYFYNWTISTGTSCARVPVVAQIDVNCNKVTDVLLTDFEKNIVLYPNPFSNEIQIDVSGEFEYILENLSGQIYLSGKGNESVILGNDLISGIYILKVVQQNICTVYKIIKK